MALQLNFSSNPSRQLDRKFAQLRFRTASSGWLQIIPQVAPGEYLGLYVDRQQQQQQNSAIRPTRWCRSSIRRRLLVEKIWKKREVGRGEEKNDNV